MESNEGMKEGVRLSAFAPTVVSGAIYEYGVRLW